MRRLKESIILLGTLGLLAATALPEDLKSLEAELALQESQKEQMQAKLAEADNKISDLKKRILAEKLRNVPYAETKAKYSGNLYQTAEILSLGQKLLTFEESAPIKVVGFDPLKGLYQIVVGEVTGYTITSNLIETPEVMEIKRRSLAKMQKEQEEGKAQAIARDREVEKQVVAEQKKQAAERVAKRATMAKEKESRLTKLYGADVARRLIGHEVFFGMSREMAMESRGKPNSINRTVTAGLVHEQWVYDGVYLYFENGKLRSFQD